MLPQIALCAKKKAWYSGDVPRRELNRVWSASTCSADRENDVRGTCVFLISKNFSKSVAHGRPRRTYGAFMLGAEAIGS